jgi:subtilisin family serine protease
LDAINAPEAWNTGYTGENTRVFILDKNGFYLDENDVMQKIPAIYIQYYVLAQQRAIDYAFRKGVVIISSAGNEGLNADGNRSIIKLPAELNNVIAVSATAPYYFYDNYNNGITDAFMDYPASYTDFGRSLVDIAAPGGDYQAYPQLNWHWDYVFSTVSGGYGWAAGTSMAAPHVAGVAALIIGKNGGDMDPHEVIKQLLKTADKIGTSGMSAYYGNGRVNAFRAVTE